MAVGLAPNPADLPGMAQSEAKHARIPRAVFNRIREILEKLELSPPSERIPMTNGLNWQ